MCSHASARVSCIAVFAVLAALTSTQASAQLYVDVESGAVFTGRNDIRIPGDTGTEFSLVDDFDPDVTPSFRLRIEYTAGGHHTFSGLYAPLTIQAFGTSDRSILFEGVTFPAGTDLEADYTFNSYRLTYRYEFTPKGRLSYGLGVTAKIRDAEIRMEGGGLKSSKSNVGFVPLINFSFRYAFSDRLTGVLAGDALGAPQGRAEDVFVGAYYRFMDTAELKLGYRILEGGADNDEVYNFALLNYAVAGLRIRF